MVETIKYGIYAVMVACFVLAGLLDLAAREWKLGLVSIEFAVMNAMIFFWR